MTAAVVSARWRVARLARETPPVEVGPLAFPRAVIAATALELVDKQAALGEAMQELAELELRQGELQADVDRLTQEIADYVRLLDRMRAENAATQEGTVP